MRQQTRDVTSGERLTDGVAGRISVRYERITVSALPPADPPRSADLPSLRGWHAGCSHRVRHTRPAARLETPGWAAVGPEGDAMANKTLFQSIVEGELGEGIRPRMIVIRVGVRRDVFRRVRGRRGTHAGSDHGSRRTGSPGHR